MVKSSQFVSFSISDMSEINKQCLGIKFCLKQGKNTTETYTIITVAIGDESLNCSMTFECFKHFKDGRKSIEDNSRSRRPS